MLHQLKNTTNQTITTNGDTAFHSTFDAVLDLFGKGGAMRRDKEEFVRLFDKALAESAELAVKTLFYLRDVRGGQGERDVFRAGLRHLANVKGQKAEQLISLVAEYGRFDDLFVLFDTPLEKAMVSFVKEQLQQDIKGKEAGENISLSAKWMPSENASSKETRALAKRFVKAFGQKPAEYRKMLVSLRNYIDIVESHLSNDDVQGIDYEKIPSKAHQQYREAFKRRDTERYDAYLTAVENGEKKVNASTLYPYDIVHRAMNTHEEDKTLDVLWNNLPDFTGGKKDNSLVVVDVSGSMQGYEPNAPIKVAMGLGLYISERNEGLFHNHFLTFSERPQLVEVKGTTILNKIRNMAREDWGYNTNLQKTFKLILDTAVRNNLPKDEMVSRLIIVSDMQFDSAVEDSSGRVIDHAKKTFETAGYTFPEIIFWNVAGHSTVPVTKNESGVALVSGASPSTLKAILACEDVSPVKLMLDVLLAERYAPVTL